MGSRKLSKSMRIDVAEDGIRHRLDADFGASAGQAPGQQIARKAKPGDLPAPVMELLVELQHAAGHGQQTGVLLPFQDGAFAFREFDLANQMPETGLGFGLEAGVFEETGPGPILPSFREGGPAADCCEFAHQIPLPGLSPP